MKTSFNSPTRGNVIDEARSWIGTPFKQRGRLKGLAVDCAGLIIGIAHALKLSNFDYTAYDQLSEIVVKRLLNENLSLVFLASVRSGDILLMRFETQSQHLAILSGEGIIHAYAQAKRCVEHQLDNTWRSRIVSAYAYMGLQD